MTQSDSYRQTYRQSGIPCIICKQPLNMKIATRRRSGKPSVTLTCSQDVRHFRAFVNDEQFVEQVMQFLEDSSIDP